MEKYPLIRTIYLYLFALLGLVLLIIAGVRFLDMALKAFVFTKAEEEERIMYKQPPYAPVAVNKLAEADGEKMKVKEGEIVLTESEKASVDQWILSYNDWQERMNKIDPITSRRHRDASMNLAMIIVGLPLYFYHWGVIKKETRKKAA